MQANDFEEEREPEAAPLAIHQGVPIRLVQSYGKSFRFVIKLQEAEGEKPEEHSFETFDAATDYIDKRSAAAAKARKLALPVLVSANRRWSNDLLEVYETATITGVNRHSRDLTGINKEKYSQPVVLPARSEIVARNMRELIEKSAVAHEIAQAFDTLIDRFRISYGRPRVESGYGVGDIPPERYGEYLDVIEQEYRESHAAALELDIDSEIEAIIAEKRAKRAVKDTQRIKRYGR